ncbi:putative bifunctional diguanylate cyclase/phosphodiesterase [Sphingomonas hylomeconis]|uniref:Bifunctional diguanylate cyclase/phosphodiesterase n=1 Tax=Sphingomonas hylomeconis TaxID=1395958 RepID=A0ABV7SP32_9SPHN|nr:EAL domain-containing protein [Sphingomonas hylomeconis]
MSTLAKPLTTPDCDRPLVVAQLLHFRQQVPWMYGLLIVNAIALAYSHAGLAPRYLTHGVPVLLVTLGLWRLFRWLLPPTRQMLDAVEATRIIRRSTILGAVFSILFVSWAIALNQYGGAYEQGHVVLFIGITVLGCLFCLTHLPRAAMIVGLFVTTPFLAYCLFSGNGVFVAIGLNIALVNAVALKVLKDAHRVFNDLVMSHGALTTERRQAEKLSDENRRLAHTDSLTGLPNRRYFFGRLETLLADTETQTGASFCVGVLDLDRFKPINDTYGHGYGDRLLGVIGQRLAAAATPDMMIARLGGDEFGVLYIGPATQAECAIRRLCTMISAPMTLGDVNVAIGCSGGIAAYPEAGTTAHELFDRADLALYHAKSTRRGDCGIFSAACESSMHPGAQIEEALQRADLAQDIDVYFQPIFDTQTMAISGVEALARWTATGIGAVPPGTLFTAAEQLGMVNAVTLAVFQRALQGIAQLPDTISLSFNLSAQDILSPPTMREIVRLVVASPIDPRRIILELTESSLRGDIAAIADALQHVRRLGMRTALDDFGSGYANLESLHRLPLDILKVDRSFLGVPGAQTGRGMVSAIHNLARALSLECTIKGIENDTQLLEVSLAGYRYAQGYLLARPMPLDAVLMTLVERETRLPDTGAPSVRPARRA